MANIFICSFLMLSVCTSVIEQWYSGSETFSNPLISDIIIVLFFKFFHGNEEDFATKK